jgi:pilus assembly protein CpaF
VELDRYLAELFEPRGEHVRLAAAVPSSDKKPSGDSPLTAAATGVESNASKSRGAADDAYREAKKQIHAQIVDRLKPGDLERLADDRRRPELRAVLERMVELDPRPLTLGQRRAIVDELLDEMLGFGPLEPLLRDPAVGDILINGAWGLFIERNGVLQEVPNPFDDAAHVLQIVQRIIARVGRQINESSPMVDARLPDGSRFNAIIAPLALNGPLVSIRRFGVKPIRFPDLVVKRSVAPEMARFLEAAVAAKLNILVSGGTGSGKTTLLNALSAFISDSERIVTIEDAAELQLQQRHVGKLEARPPNVEGKGQITIRDLLRNALRMRPDRIVIGECRGAEALDMLQAMNTGHAGSLTTLHANTPRDALSRLETMIMMTGLELSMTAMRQQIASAINLVVHIERLSGGNRRITRITEVTGLEKDVITTQDLFVFAQTGIDSSGRALGQFETTGVASHYASRLHAVGIHLPVDAFRRRVLLEV